MTLVERFPDSLPADPSRHERFTFQSPADGTTQTANVYAPSRDTGEPLPLVLAPHPITWRPEEDYHGGLTGMKRGYHRGWYGLADKYQVIIAMPHGHHRREESCSVAGPEQIADLIHLIDALAERGYRVDQRRVYTCGLSMGGQEALVLAGRHPDKIAAAVAFNPIVDLAAWQEDLANHEVAEIRSFGTDRRIANEVGGLPREVPDLYAERSATTYADALSQVPTLLYWTEKDLIVPRQITHHSYLLYRMVKERGVSSPIAEYNHTRSHAVTLFDDDTRWQLHEWCDYELALMWMLHHRR